MIVAFLPPFCMNVSVGKRNGKDDFNETSSNAFFFLTRMTTNILTPIIRWSWRVADIDFRTNYFKVINKLLPIRLSEYDAKRKAKATNLPFDVAKDMVTAMVDGNKVFSSFGQ